MKFGKTYIKNLTLYESQSYYNIDDAYNIISKMVPARFNESIDISIIVKRDIKKPLLKSNLILPHGNGKKIRILLLINDGDNNVELKKLYGIDDIGGDFFIKNILEKKIALKYNYIITTPKMFPQLKPIAKILGPKGLMPTVKNDTVTDNIQEIITNLYKGKTNIKYNKDSTLNLSIGRRSFTYKQIHENLKAIYMAITATKSTYIKNIFLASTMSPSIKINIDKFK